MGGLLHSATAGTDESGDVVVTVTPADQTQIILHTALRAQFGEAMKQTVGELLDAQQLTALVELHDRGEDPCFLCPATRRK